MRKDTLLICSIFSPYSISILTLHKSSNKNGLDCMKCACGHDFLDRGNRNRTGSQKQMKMIWD